MADSWNSASWILFDLTVSLEVEAHGRGAVSKLAEAAGCDRTYLSQCLSTKVQPTPDHVLGIGQYLNLSESESDYFLLLLLHERSASKKSQLLMEKKMKILSEADLILSKKIAQKAESNELTETEKSIYYSHWKYAATHALTSIKEFQTVPAIAKRTKLTDTEISNALKDLKNMGLVLFQAGSWVHSGKSIHISSGSSHTSQNHTNWRLKSIENVNSQNAVHYTTLFSLSKKDWQILREQLLRFIETQMDFIHASGTEELYCFCCDLFKPLE
ncbi:MAG: DUF4423 domain-containing protein [Pseudobdellovibrionaceae bacterium]